jgi:hypothetical protein
MESRARRIAALAKQKFASGLETEIEIGDEKL